MDLSIDGQQLNFIGSLAIMWGSRVLGAIIALVVGWVAASWLAGLVRKVVARVDRVDNTIGGVMARVVRIAVIVLTLLAVLDRFGVETTSIVALLGAAGLAIGLALQGALSNVASGVMLLGLRPFKLGDAVDVGGTVGIVEDIGLFLTRLKTFDGVAVYLPNSQIWGSELKNFTANENRRLNLIFGIGYADDANRALEILKEIVDSDDRILKEPEPLVVFESLGESSVNLLVRPWVHRTNLLKVRFDLTQAVKEHFDREGISFPFPQTDVHLIPQNPTPEESN